MTGQIISHYQILEKLGEGGMGVVYKAEDLKLKRLVALKFLPVEHRDRFLREAQAAAALNHPNICTIHEVDEVHGFLAMELVEGKSLRDKIAERPLKLDEAFGIAIQVCHGLQVAHERGVVHRDIKPANLMVTAQGLVKIMDFGLAQIGERSRITKTGASIGTPAYMSPEQAQGEPTNKRTDLWSLGVVIYEMVSGRLPFSGETDRAMTSGILHLEAEPLTALRSGVPKELDRIVAKALRKKPEERYAHAEDLRVDLQHAQSAPRSERAAKGKTLDWRSAALAALTLGLVIAAGLWWQASRRSQNGEPLRAVALTTFAGVEYYPSFSPDGNTLVFTWTGLKQDNQDLYVQMIGSGSPLRLTTDPRHDYNPVWSPDGRWIAFLSGPPPAPTGVRSREVRIIHPLGGSERKLADIRGQDFGLPGALLAWAPDSSALVVTDSQGDGKPDALFVLSPETGEKRPLTNPQAPVLADTSPAISPDGRWLVFLRRTSWGYGELHLLPLGKGLTAAGEPKRLTPGNLLADYPAWMPDSSEIIFSAKSSLWRLAVPGENAPVRIAYIGDDGLMPALSRPGPGKPLRLAYVRSFADANFWRIETSAPGAPATSAPTLAIASTKPEYHIRFSPDGRRVVFASSRPGPEIWVSDADGANAVQLTSMNAQETMCPYWSPDGQRIAFASNPEGEFDIYVVPAAGGKPSRLTSHPGIDICPSFSRDGQSIYFSSMRSGDYRVWKMPASGGEAVQVTHTPGGGAAIESLDKRTLYYNTVGVVSSVWGMPMSGGEPSKVIDGVIWFNYSLFDRGFYYIDRQGSESRLQYLNMASGKATTVARNLGDVSAGLAVSPDGKTILFTRMDSSADDLMLVENFR